MEGGYIFAPNVAYAVLVIIGAFVIHEYSQKVIKAKAQIKAEDAFAAKQGCLPMEAATKGKWPWALDLIKGLIDANADMRLLAFQQRFLDELGPNLEQRLLGDVGLVTIEPENAKAILSKSATRDGELDFYMGKGSDAFYPFLGDGLFTLDGPAWKLSREILRKQFARIQYQNLSVFSDHVEHLVNRLQTSEPIVDLLPLFFNYTLDTTTALLFGEAADSLNEQNEDSFGRYFDEASWISALRVKLVDFYWVYTPPRYKVACNAVKAYADNYVEKALAVNEDADQALLDQYSFIRNLYKDLGDRVSVRDQLVNVLLAGRDTTACLLSWTLRLLIRHPDALTRLRGEIQSVLGQDTSVTRTHVQKMAYLRNVLDETLRLYPSVPLNVRAAVEPTVLPRGGGPDGTHPTLVRKGQGVGFSPYHMHRRTDLYGKDANEFRPERWDEGDLRDTIGWGYLPFNGGPRICLGKDFALMEASFAVIRIIQSFPNLHLPADEKVGPVGTERQQLTMVVSPADGCRVQLR